jgi:ethanolamine utilization protein EutA
VAFDAEGGISRIEPSARSVADSLGIQLQLGHPLAAEAQRRIAEKLAGCLFQVIRREPLDELTRQLMLTPRLESALAVEVVTFSGGVSEYLYEGDERATPDFGDLARPLAEAIRARIEQHQLPAGIENAAERIRATVIGASQFTVQVSGNTIAISRPEMLPLHNLQVLYPQLPDRDEIRADELSAAIARSYRRFDLQEGEQTVAVAIKWAGEPRYAALRSLAQGIVQASSRTIAAGLPLVVVFANDFGKLIGGIIREEFLAQGQSDVISIDGIELQEFDYIDIGAMIVPSQVVPVVVKSLVFPEASGPPAEVANRVMA